MTLKENVQNAEVIILSKMANVISIIAMERKRLNIAICVKQVLFTDENNNMGLCIGFDGTKDETATTGIHTETDDAKGFKIQLALMAIMLVIAF